jgi:hypothetical protein
MTHSVITLGLVTRMLGQGQIAGPRAPRRAVRNGRFSQRSTGVEPDAKEQPGHSSLATTQRYFKADPIEVQAAVDQLRF